VAWGDPDPPWRVWAAAGRVERDSPELAAVERRADVGDQRAIKRLGVARHEHDDQITVLAAQVVDQPQRRRLRARAGVWLRRGAQVAVDSLEHVHAVGSCVVVSNHQYGLDPIAQLRSLPISLRARAMRELFRIPLLGRAMRTIGMIEVDRGSLDFGEIDTAMKPRRPLGTMDRNPGTRRPC